MKQVRVLLAALVLLALGALSATAQADDVRGRLFRLDPSLLSAQALEDAEYAAWEAGELEMMLGPEISSEASSFGGSVEQDGEGDEEAYAEVVLPSHSRSFSLQMARAVDALKGAQTQCIACTLVVSLLEQYAWESRKPLSAAANDLCSALTVQIPSITGLCQLFIAGTVRDLQKDFDNKVSPDVTCRTVMKACEMPQCNLFSQWPVPAKSERVGLSASAGLSERVSSMAHTIAKFLNVHTLSEETLQTQLKEFGGRLHEKKDKWIPIPIPDDDRDLYSSKFTYRGLAWRGQDCDDANSTIYPGRNALQGDFDATVDTNCNGIYGVDPRSGITWEQAMCGQTPSRGLLAIGDSATAHFSLPPSFITPSEIDMHTYERLIETLLTEIDWPQCSWSTGFVDASACPASKLPVSSIYSRMKERNRCMHRDFVNAGVNGQSVDNLIDDASLISGNYSGALEAIPPRFKTDGPSTVFFSLIGNDICRAKSWDAYTPVSTFAKKAVAELRYLDTKLAKGSHVVLMGLVDGRVLFETLQGARHPIGATYADFYDYLNCLGTSPCWGWMNTNATIRDASTFRAMEYNKMYQEIIASHSFENFKLHYYYPDYAKMVKYWVDLGHDPAELIEAVDGFHPSQTGNMLLAADYWEWLSINVPEALGQLNPNNADILKRFGEQGGHGL